MSNTRIPFTEEEKNMICMAARRVWHDIAHDIMQALKEGGNQARMPRRDVIEVIMDADRLDQKMKDMRYTEDLRSRVQRAESRQIERILEKEFTHAEYA